MKIQVVVKMSILTRESMLRRGFSEIAYPLLAYFQRKRKSAIKFRRTGRSGARPPEVADGQHVLFDTAEEWMDHLRRELQVHIPIED